MGIFKQRRRAHCYRRFHRIEECKEVGYQRIGQLRREEMLQNLLVGQVAEGGCIKVVGVHELIENVGTEHHGLGYHGLHGGEFVEILVTLDDVVEE